MIEYVELSVSSERVSQSVFDFVRPATAETYTFFRVFGQATDPMIVETIRRLAAHGCKPQSKPWEVPTSGEYSCFRTRIYDHDDLKSCDFLEIRPPLTPQATECLVINGQLVFSRKHLKRTTDMLDTGDGYVCPDRVRQLIESQRMECCAFYSTRLGKYGPDGNLYEFADWLAFREPWWQLGSSLRLPPVSSTLIKTNHRGEFVPHDHRGFTWIREPPYFDSTLRYKEAAFRGSGSFDIASTFEYTTTPLACRLVVSKRFYDCWRSAGLKAVWRPVILES